MSGRRRSYRPAGHQRYTGNPCAPGSAASASAPCCSWTTQSCAHSPERRNVVGSSRSSSGMRQSGNSGRCYNIIVITVIVLLQAGRYFVKARMKWGSESQNWKHHRAIWKTPDFSEKMPTEVVRAHHTIIWTGQDYPTGNSSRRETKRQTEETMGRQHQRVDRPWMEYHTTESGEPRGVEEAGCKIYSGGPTVSQTTG